MMYLVSTPYEKFVFETEEEAKDFIKTAALPVCILEQVKSSPMYERMALDTRWRLM